jgi:hypothetical protein
LRENVRGGALTILTSVLATILLLNSDAHSQQQYSASISITASAPCRVYGDTTDLGSTPASWTVQKPGTVIVHVIPQAAANEKEWGAPAIVETLTVNPGDRIEKNYQIPILYHIASEPYGADVFLHDSLVGRTPCTLAIACSNKFIKLEADGFENTELPLDPAQTSVHVSLSPRSALSNVNGTALTHPESVNNTPLYTIGAATVVSGVLAATCKIKADNIYGDYRSTGDGSVVPGVHTYDTISGISLAATQVGIIWLSYLLLSR